MRRLEVRFNREPGSSRAVGILAEQRGRIYFEYAPEFLETGRSLSPFRLPFRAGLFEHRDWEFGPLPGLFDDSLPDGWGLLLMDRRFRELGLDARKVSSLDRLAWLGTRTMGALTYHPPADDDGSDRRSLDLHRLATHARELLSGSVSEVLPVLLRAGGSPAGARPKVLVGFHEQSGEIISGEEDLPPGFEHWIVKFASEKDDPETGAIEYAYSLMARDAGIEMPPTRLFETSQGGRYFGVRRFDRTGNRRYHVHTLGGLLHSNFRIPAADYLDLLEATSLLTRDHRHVLRAYRLAVFNLLAHNRDDHVKNFAFLLDDEIDQWSLAPAYDLLLSFGPAGEHSTTYAGEGRAPGRSHLQELAKAAGIRARDAGSVFEEVLEAVRRWSRHGSDAGISQDRLARVAEVLSAGV